MKPMIILPPDVMSPEDIQILRDNGICVVVSQDPAKLKFVDPLPAQSSRNEIEWASIKLSRMLLNGAYTSSGISGGSVSPRDMAQLFVSVLIEGTPLDPKGSREEQEQRIIDDARRNELYQIGREEARAEAKARKEAKKAQEKK